MSFGSSDDGGSEAMRREAERAAQEARDREEARQSMLSYGDARIDALFQGGDYWSAPEHVMYESDGINPSLQTNTSRQQENALGFQQDFYDNYGQAYMDYVTPQYEDQYAQAQADLRDQLASAGLGSSSTATDAYADLKKQYDQGYLDFNQNVLNMQGDLEGQVNAAKTSAHGLLHSTEDPTLAVNQALSSIMSLNKSMPDTSPLAQMFKQATFGLGNYNQGQEQYNLNKLYNSLDPNGSGTLHEP